MKYYDVVILTKKEFYEPKDPDWYIKQVITEDSLLQSALEKKGLNVTRTYWDNPNFDFSLTQIVLFRTIWDYFYRFDEFSDWLEKVKTKTSLINPPELIYWNIDKHYLLDLKKKGIKIPATVFIEKGDSGSLKDCFKKNKWSQAVLKPAVSGAGRHTYLLSEDETDQYENIYKELIKNEAMMLQEYQFNIVKKGEAAFIMINGKFSHSILKKVKKGDFRVQDDFGGTVHNYKAKQTEIEFAEKVVSACSPLPIYARVDIIWDNDNNPAVGELELIEPELWFRYHPPASEALADAIYDILS